MSDTWNDAPGELVPEDVAYAEIADSILDGLRKDPNGQWRMPWHSVEGGRPANAFSGRPFTGQNIITLWKAATQWGFATHLWASRDQWERKRGKVRPGEMGTSILVPVFDELAPATRWSPRDRKIARRLGPVGGDPAGGELRPLLGFQRQNWYNAAQVAGVTVAPPATPSVSVGADHLIARIKHWVLNGGPALEHGGQQAHWRMDVDRITMPIIEAFSDYDGISGKEYYATTLGHEAVHATGSTHRLNRSTLKDYHKDKRARAREELVAELGAAFLNASAGLKTTQRSDHALYVRSWIQWIADKDQRHTYFWAVTQAERAANFILARTTDATPSRSTEASSRAPTPKPGDAYRAFLARLPVPSP